MHLPPTAGFSISSCDLSACRRSFRFTIAICSTRKYDISRSMADSFHLNPVWIAPVTLVRLLLTDVSRATRRRATYVVGRYTRRESRHLFCFISICPRSSRSHSIDIRIIVIHSLLLHSRSRVQVKVGCRSAIATSISCHV